MTIPKTQLKENLERWIARESLKRAETVWGEFETLEEEEQNSFKEIKFDFQSGAHLLLPALLECVADIDELHRRIGSCPYSNTDKWGGMMEYVYRKTNRSLDNLTKRIGAGSNG